MQIVASYLTEGDNYMIRPNTKRAATLEYICRHRDEQFSTTTLNAAMGFDCSVIVTEFIRRGILKFHCGNRTEFGKGKIMRVGEWLDNPKQLPARRVKSVISIWDI